MPAAFVFPGKGSYNNLSVLTADLGWVAAWFRLAKRKRG